MAKAKGQDNRAALWDHIVDHLHNNHRSWSTDTLMCHPTDAMRMGLAVQVKMQRITPSAAKLVSRLINEIENAEPRAVDAIQEACMAAMNLRKHGKVPLKKRR